MILDPKTGVTLKDVADFLSDMFDYNKDGIESLRDTINKDYEVSDDVLDALEHKEQMTPDDIRTLARAVGMDYELLTSDELAPDFGDRFNKAVANLYKVRNKYKMQPKQEVPDASTINPAN